MWRAAARNVRVCVWERRGVLLRPSGKTPLAKTFPSAPPSTHNAPSSDRLVVELFNDIPSARASATAFAARCRPGADGGFAGAPLAGVAPGTALFGGGRAPARAVVAPRASASLTHCEPGAVSLSTTGGSWAVALTPTPSLDSPAWGVCGRLTGESLAAAVALGGVGTGRAAAAGGGGMPTGARPPAVPHTVRAAGVTDCRGAHEAAGAAGGGGGGAPASLGAGVEAALQASLAGNGDADKAGAAVNTHPPAPGVGKKRGRLDELLGGSGSEGDESESD